MFVCSEITQNDYVQVLLHVKRLCRARSANSQGLRGQVVQIMLIADSVQPKRIEHVWLPRPITH